MYIRVRKGGRHEENRRKKACHSNGRGGAGNRKGKQSVAAVISREKYSSGITGRESRVSREKLEESASAPPQRGSQQENASARTSQIGARR